MNAFFSYKSDMWNVKEYRDSIKTNAMTNEPTMKA